MPTNHEANGAHQWCSLVSKANREDPIGTAGNRTLYVLIEMPMPWIGLWTEAKTAPQALLDVFRPQWDRDVALRPLALAPDPAYSRDGARRVMFYKRPEGPFATFEKAEYFVPEDALVALIDAYLAEPDCLSEFEPYRQDTAQIRELLVCTHGTVDRCCAKYGYPAYSHLRKASADDGEDKLRVWRTSHFGGHRFAPTVLEFPEARSWAHLTTEAMHALLRREGPVSALRPFYRGWAGLSDPFLQVAEREAWECEGWDWLTYLKWGQVIAEDEEADEREPMWAEVRIKFEHPTDGPQGAYEARIEASDRVLAGGCGEEIEPVAQYRVTDWVRRAPAAVAAAP